MRVAILAAILGIVAADSWSQTSPIIGSSWISTPISARGNIMAIDGVAEDFLIGVSDAGEVIRWTGTKWVEWAPLPPQVAIIHVDLDVVSRECIWVATDRKVYLWDGHAWQDKTPTVSGERVFHRVRFLSPGHGFVVGAVGEQGKEPRDGLILEYINDAWSSNQAMGMAGFFAIDISSGTAWAAGLDSRFIQYRDSKWTSSSTYVQSHTMDLSLESPVSGWAVSHYGILQLEGDSWVSSTKEHPNWGAFVAVASDAGAALVLAVEMDDDSDVVGTRIGRLRNGTWSEDAFIPHLGLSDIVVLPGGAAWAVGGQGKVFFRAKQSAR